MSSLTNNSQRAAILHKCFTTCKNTCARNHSISLSILYRTTKKMREKRQTGCTVSLISTFLLPLYVYCLSIKKDKKKVSGRLLLDLFATLEWFLCQCNVLCELAVFDTILYKNTHVMWRFVCEREKSNEREQEKRECKIFQKREWVSWSFEQRECVLDFY